MLVMDFEGKNLADVPCLQIHRNIGGKAGQKWSIVGHTVHLTELSGGIICAYYADEEQAKAELEKIAAFAEENPGKVYRFSR